MASNIISSTSMGASANVEKSLFSSFHVQEAKTLNDNHLHKDQTLTLNTSSKAIQSEENNSIHSLSKGEDLACDHKQVSSITTTMESSSMEETDPSPLDHANQDDQLILSAKAEMGQVREENEKLKQTLTRILQEYKSLQMQFNDVVNQEIPTSSTRPSTFPHDREDDESKLISLSLGRTSGEPKRNDQKKIDFFSKSKEEREDDQELKLGLDCKFDPTQTKVNSNNSKKEEPIEPLPPISSLKTERSQDNDLLNEIPMKKARVSVRAICDGPTMNDGCQWRKYGQKIAKGNPCPRAYYRCTVSPSCPVRKHVQRCADDKSVLITTYEGTHNHTLPVSATAMASTTSAAASMLKSTSSTSQPGLIPIASSTKTAATSTTFASLHGMNYNSRVPHYPVYFPTTTISTYQSHPTITLDLTANSHFSGTSSNLLSAAPRFSSSTCLNFSSPSSSSSSSIESNYQTRLGISYNRRQKEAFNQTPYAHNNCQIYSSSASQEHSAKKIAAATKALTSSASFRSALAASITSLVGNVGAGGRI